MKRRLLYLVGAPGVGKSSLMAALTADWSSIPISLAGVNAVDYRDRQGRAVAAQLGVVRENFSGTDGLQMSIMPKAIAALPAFATGYPLLLAEGDRLASLKFLVAAREAGFEVTLVHLIATAEETERRRAERGSHQQEAWVRGRTTKAANLAAAWAPEGRVVTMDATHDGPERLATVLQMGET